jgi:hypothetical protein
MITLEFRVRLLYAWSMHDAPISWFFFSNYKWNPRMTVIQILGELSGWLRVPELRRQTCHVLSPRIKCEKGPSDQRSQLAAKYSDVMSTRKRVMDYVISAPTGPPCQ